MYTTIIRKTSKPLKVKDNAGEMNFVLSLLPLIGGEEGVDFVPDKFKDGLADKKIGFKLAFMTENEDFSVFELQTAIMNSEGAVELIVPSYLFSGNETHVKFIKELRSGDHNFSIILVEMLKLKSPIDGEKFDLFEDTERVGAPSLTGIDRAQFSDEAANKELSEKLDSFLKKEKRVNSFVEELDYLTDVFSLPVGNEHFEIVAAKYSTTSEEVIKALLSDTEKEDTEGE